MITKIITELWVEILFSLLVLPFLYFIARGLKKLFVTSVKEMFAETIKHYFDEKWQKIDELRKDNRYQEISQNFKAFVAKEIDNTLSAYFTNKWEEDILGILQNQNHNFHTEIKHLQEEIQKLQNFTQDKQEEANSWNLQESVEQLQKMIEDLPRRLQRIDTFAEHSQRELQKFQDKLAYFNNEADKNYDTLLSKIDEIASNSEQNRKATEQEFTKICEAIENKTMQSELDGLCELVKNNHQDLLGKHKDLLGKHKDLLDKIESNKFRQSSDDSSFEEKAKSENFTSEPQTEDPFVGDRFEYLPVKFSEKLLPKEKRTWRSLAFYNYKGGVGKTTLAYNIGHDLAQRYDKKVLLIDADPQANLSYLTLKKRYDGVYWTVPKLFREMHEGKAKNIYHVNSLQMISSYHDNVSIIPNQHTQRSIEEGLVSYYCQEQDLRNIWIKLLDQWVGFDYIIFDCPPNMGFVTQSVLAVSDIAFVPVVPGISARYGLNNFTEGFGRWYKCLGYSEHSDFKIILNNFASDKSCEDQITSYKSNPFQKDKILNTIIPTIPQKIFSASKGPISLGEIDERKSPTIQNILDSLYQVTNEIVDLLDRSFANDVPEKEKEEDNNGEDKQ